MGVADRAALIEVVDDDFRGSHQRRIDFLFAAVVGAHGGDESARAYVFAADEELSRRCAADADVAVFERRGNIARRFEREAQFVCETASEILGGGVVRIERENSLQRKYRCDRAKLGGGLLATAANRRDK